MSVLGETPLGGSNGVWDISRVFGGFTWPSKVGVSVVPRVLVILEHIQTSGLQKK